jgi:hypothetical protein
MVNPRFAGPCQVFGGVAEKRLRNVDICLAATCSNHFPLSACFPVRKSPFLRYSIPKNTQEGPMTE